jgi:hypothetical protein
VTVTAFSGVNESVHTAIGGANQTGAFTLAAWLRKNTDGVFHAIIGNHDSGGTARCALELRNTNVVAYNDGAAGVFSTSTVLVGDGWVLVVVTKAAGTVTPRAHIYKGTSWVHENMSGTKADSLTQAGGTIRFGEWQGVDDFNGRLARAAEWNVALTDAQVEELYGDIARWLGNSGGAPVGAWNFTSSPLTDLTGGGADETARAGTTLVSDEPAGLDGALLPPPSFGPRARKPDSGPLIFREQRYPPDLGVAPPSAADTLGTTDSATRQVTFARTAGDTLGSSDAAARTVVLARAASDTLGTTDSAARAATAKTRTASDTLATTDAASRAATSKARTGSDALGTTDAATRAATVRARTASDSLATTDQATRTASLRLRSVADTLGTTDQATRAAYLRSRTAADSLGTTDQAVKGGAAIGAAADTLGTTDAATRASGLRSRTASDTLGTSDQTAAGGIRFRSAQDTLATVDIASRVVVKSLTAQDTLGTTDTAVALVTGPGRGHLTLTDRVAGTPTHSTRTAGSVTRGDRVAPVPTVGSRAAGTATVDDRDRTRIEVDDG